ncbi:serine/threonine-protein kinase [Microbacterium trichothecenolyticum]|uniref:non-specific serine/threonine protein kinase n=1 Tax=Microbacterium trichothecenolyticum TaxID=69370 RepID=A0ABU0U0K1_MICTR|nr:serine/threonine-protein kinase [Microbacterium trichothecenolyticum]MDQ1124714.1 serine/threonine protein kinase [Microbacterium trichothecenolyticum]
MSRPPSTPPQLAGFEPIRLLGSGGFADVFLYRQQHPEREVAVKAMHAHRLDEAAVRGFTDEANLMAKLAAHPHIVSVYGAGVSEGGRPYLVMEYCSKPNLQVRHRRERFSEAETLRIGVQIAGAIETAHRAGILHRDIKPANILVTSFGRPKLTDFGIAGAATSAVTAMSVPWSPPESFAGGGSSGPASDVYSLAATLYTLLTNRGPFEIPGASNGEIDVVTRIESMPLPPTGRPDVSPALEAVLARAMSKDPRARYASALEFGHALQHVQIQHGMQETTIDVEEEDLLPIDDDGEELVTRFRGITSIDAQPVAPASVDVRTSTARPTTPVAAVVPDTTAPVRPPIVSAPAAAPSWSVPSAPAPLDTVRRQVEEVEQPVAAPAPAPRRRRSLVIGGVAAAVIVLAVGGAIAAATLTPSPPAVTASTAPRPVDAVPAAHPVSVTALTGSATDAGVRFAWTNPDPLEGDRYLWRTVVPGTETTFQETADTAVVVPADPSGRTCIEVLLRRSDGTSAASGVEGCVP